MGRKTSVYLTDQDAERVKASGVPLPELIRRGLAADAPAPLESALPGLIRSVLDEWWAGHGNGSAVAPAVLDGSDEGQQPPRAAPPERKRRAPAKHAAAPPEHDATVPVFQVEGDEPVIPPLLAPACRHPVDKIQADGTCKCGEEMPA